MAVRQLRASCQIEFADRSLVAHHACACNRRFRLSWPVCGGWVAEEWIRGNELTKRTLMTMRQVPRYILIILDEHELLPEYVPEASHHRTPPWCGQVAFTYGSRPVEIKGATGYKVNIVKRNQLALPWHCVTALSMQALSMTLSLVSVMHTQCIVNCFN